MVTFDKKEIANCKAQYELICNRKLVQITEKGFWDYHQARTSIYHGVCLDIDDTLTFNCLTERRAIVEVLATLTKRNVIICFITGRGKTKAFEFLLQLKEAVCQYDSEIRERQFGRWYCITNNGVTLFSNDYIKDYDFMGRSINLVTSEIKSEYLSCKRNMQREIASIIAEKTGLSVDKVIDDSRISTSENSLRFPVSEKYAEYMDDELIDKLRKLVAKKYHKEFGVSRGVYNKNNKTVIEVSMTTKGKAISQVEKYLGIPQNKMVRVGDQGDFSGNDYEMLNCACGFSVGRYSKEDGCCWPVIEEFMYGDMDIVTGPKATAILLKSLRIFSTICLETPSKESYSPKLAMSEQINIAANRDTNNYYENQIRHSFKNGNQMFTELSDIIDRTTGGFFVSDAEYALLKAKNPNHILFKIYDRKVYSSKKNPRLRFALHTDDGLLLRGPLNYYYGLAFRKNKRITNKEAKRLNENRINFFKISLAALKQTKVDASDVTARKAILGILDSVRDYLLIYINFELQSRAENEDVLYVVNKEDCKLFDIFAMAKKNLCFMYNSLFGIIDANYIKDIEIFLEKSVLPAAQRANESIKRLEMEFNYNKAFRVWREIDSFYENVIAIDTSLHRFVNERNTINHKVYFYGIRYGSLELPIIASMLLDIKYRYFNIDYYTGAVCLNSDYSSNHKEVLETDRYLNKVMGKQGKEDKKELHVLMDDNLVTGRTLQIAINLLVNADIYPEKIFVVRYPALNRIEHMFLPNHGAPDVDLFWQFVYGLTSPTPYTKLDVPYGYSNMEEDKYLDFLGEFNKTRTYIDRLLYKNGLFVAGGEVKK